MVRIGSRISCLFSSFSLSLLRGPTFRGTSQLEKLRSTSVWHYIPYSSHCERCVAYQAGGGGVNPFQGASRLAIRKPKRGEQVAGSQRPRNRVVETVCVDFWWSVKWPLYQIELAANISELHTSLRSILNLCWS